MELSTLLPPRHRDRTPRDYQAHDDVETSMGELALASAAAMVAGVAARSAVKLGWRVWRNADPPTNPASKEVAWVDAIAWAAATGAVVGVMRIVGRRGATAAWRRWS